jgi:hypothetical protein
VKGCRRCCWPGYTGQTGVGLGRQGAGFRAVMSLGLVQEDVVLVVGLESLQVVCLLGVLPLMLNTGMGGVVALRWRGGTVHGFGSPPVREGWFPHSGYHGRVRGGSFDRRNVLDCTNLTLEQWPSTGFTLLVLTPVLSCLFAHVLIFEFQVGDLKNISLIDSGCSRYMTRDKGWFSSLVPVVTKRYITFGTMGKGVCC